MFRNVILFLTLTFLLTFAITAPFWFGADPELLAIATPLGMLIPGIAAVLAWTLGEKPLESFHKEFATARHRRMGLALALTVAVFVAIALTQLLLSTAFGIAEWHLPAEPAALAGGFAVQFAIMFVGSIGEEFAWRGWLHTQLRALGFWPTALAISTIWMLWHLPILGIAWSAGLDSPVTIAVTIANLVVFGVLLHALRERTGSVWPAVLGHALMNSVFVLVKSNLIAPLSDTAFVAWSVLGWAAAAIAIGAFLRTARHRKGGIGTDDGTTVHMGP